MFRNPEREEELIEKVASAIVSNDTLKDLAEVVLETFRPISGLGRLGFVFLFPFLEASSLFTKGFGHDLANILAYSPSESVDRLLRRINELEQEKKK